MVEIRCFILKGSVTISREELVFEEQNVEECVTEKYIRDTMSEELRFSSSCHPSAAPLRASFLLTFWRLAGMH